MSDHRRNLELKVRCAAGDLDRIRRRLESLTCAPIQSLHQVDTYLQVDRGRLKLREVRRAGDPAQVDRAELIAYARPSDDGSRWSAYRVVPIAPNAVPDLLAALLMTHERLAVVEKLREVALIGQTRVHLDTVTALGAFVELETVLVNQGEAEAAAEHQQVISLLDLGRLPAISGSYSDLILATDRPG